MLHLNYSGTDTVNALSVGGVAKSPGVYSASNSPFITGSGTLTVLTGPPSDYETWRLTHAITGGPGDDADQDGLSNQFEYAFGLDPTSPSGTPVAFLSLDAGPHVTYTRRRQALSGLDYSVWTSTDLTDWTEDTGAVEGTPVLNGDVETVPVTLTPSLLSNQKLFTRITSP